MPDFVPDERDDLPFIDEKRGLAEVCPFMDSWANKFTNLVNDEPSEAQLTPSEWGAIALE